MRLINVVINGSTSSLVAPPKAACWALHLDTEAGKGYIAFRKKLLTETSFLTSLNNVRREVPSLDWQSTSGNPTSDTSGGIDATESPYCTLALVFDKRSGMWMINAQAAMSGYLMAQRDVGGSVPNLPAANDQSIEQLRKSIDKLKASIKPT
jgi:hypothetical protein